MMPILQFKVSICENDCTKAMGLRHKAMIVIARKQNCRKVFRSRGMAEGLNTNIQGIPEIGMLHMDEFTPCIPAPGVLGL